MLLHQFFEHSADLYPGHTAIEDSNDTLTYAEVERLANQVAHYLIDLGAVPESTVAIMLPRSAFVYIAMIGILKTGAAYIPIDPETPGERTDFILEHSEALLLISSDAVFNRIGTVLKNRKVWNIDQERSRIESYPTIRFSQNKATLSNLCYIIYTSGSTGKPKGVLLEHGNVVTYLNSALQIYPITHKDRALQGFSVSFDASVEEIWVPFAVGATIVVGTIGLMRSGNQFSGLVNRLNISYLSCAPTLLSMVDEDIPTVKILIFGGEVCPPGLAYKWCSEGRFVFNTYGPTEAAVVATYKEIKPTRPVTLGTAMPQYIVKILNEDLSPVCGHEEGEIYIGGSSIARGYLNLPDLTGQKFIITDKITGNSIRFFKTGDIARYSDDGEIIYIGRTDAQVKVRGYRVELTEIEGLLSQCQGVKAAVVALNPATQQLSSYVVVQPGETINREQISRMLRSGLPFYMIPSTLDEIDMFPMTTGLKIDRSKLPSPRVPLTSYSRKHRILPTTELEKVLIEQLEQHFNFTDLSMDDNFFDDLGGHSLKAALLVSDLRKHPMFASVSVGDLYKFPILIDLACELESRQTNQHPNDDQPRNFYKPPSIKYYCCGLFQGMALVFLMFLFGIEWLGPFFVYSYSDHMGLGIIHSLCIMLAAYFILLPVITAFAILFKWVVIGKFKPGTYKLWGSYYFRF